MKGAPANGNSSQGCKTLPSQAQIPPNSGYNVGGNRAINPITNAGKEMLKDPDLLHLLSDISTILYSTRSKIMILDHFLVIF